MNFRFFSICKIFFTFLVFVFFYFKASSQNLLANGSFEDENTCTEFHEKCSPAAWINISLNPSVTVNSYALDGSPFDGNHFVKIIAFNNKIKDSKSFMSTRLLCSLRKGNIYTIELSYRASFKAIDSFGVLFSSRDFLYEKKVSKEIIPNIWIKGFDSASGEKYYKWARRKYMYTATGEETSVTFGIFKKSDFVFADNKSIEDEQYVYLDSISMVPNDKNELACKLVDSSRIALYRRHDRHGLLSRLASMNNSPPVIMGGKTILRFIDSLLLPDITFESGKSKVNLKESFLLDSLIEIIAHKKIDSVLIEGHTDNIGESKKNDTLGTQRALAVSEYLIHRLAINPQSVQIKSYADKRPIDSNATLAGRQRNRRVEIYVYSNRSDQ